MTTVLDSTYGLALPPVYFDWMNAFYWLGNLNWWTLWLPDECVLYTDQRLIFYAVAPLLLIAAAAVMSVLYHALLVMSQLRGQPMNAAALTKVRTAVSHGLVSSLPCALVVVSFFVASVSPRIFQTRACIGFGVDDATEEERFYLREDLSIMCYESKEHAHLVSLMWIFVCVWPIGTLVLYVLVLVPCRTPILRGESTALTRAIAFLIHDYQPVSTHIMSRRVCEH